MSSLKILNSKEKKELIKLIFEQFGFEFSKGVVFLRSNKDKIYLINKSIEDVYLDKLRIDHLGLYVGKLQNDLFRPSIEGSQIIGPKASKNVLEVDSLAANDWFLGKDLDYKGESVIYIIKHKNDFLGAGKCNGEKIFTGVPKSRRLKVVNEG